VGILITKAIQKNFRGPVRDVIVIAIGDEQQLRGGANPDSSETYFKAGHEI
jgi:hypothetical protein